LKMLVRINESFSLKRELQIVKSEYRIFYFFQAEKILILN